MNKTLLWVVIVVVVVGGIWLIMRNNSVDTDTVGEDQSAAVTESSTDLPASDVMPTEIQADAPVTTEMPIETTSVQPVQ